MIQMAREHYGRYRWVQAVNAALAFWLFASPHTLGYPDTLLGASDIASGLAVLVLAVIALDARKGLASWAQSLVGMWLLFAPLAFHTPSAAGYANDTIVGSLLILFGLVIPMAMEMPGTADPPGWSYNPSTWPQRAPVILLALLSFLASRWMAAFQLGHIGWVPDPFFGDGTERVLQSDVSRAWPVSDAGLGAMAYMIELLSTCMGDRRRWRTMPWMVAIFGLAVIPLGVVSIVLVVLQPVAVGAWCSLCLFTAAAMLLMIPLALDEVFVMLQFVRDRQRRGESLWRVFWLGSDLDRPNPAPPAPDSWTFASMVSGLTGPPTLYALMALGIFVMAVPGLFAAHGAFADSCHVVGALVVVFGGIALAEIGRATRFLAIPAGAWLSVSPWILEGATDASRWSLTVAGLLVILTSLPLGRIHEHYGDFDRFVDWAPTPLASRRTRRHA